MNAIHASAFPHAPRWSAGDLADAVPRPLHALYAVAGLPARAGNASRRMPAPRRWRAGYVAQPPLPARFRVD